MNKTEANDYTILMTIIKKKIAQYAPNPKAEVKSQ